jgi:hypothetical protein
MKREGFIWLIVFVLGGAGLLYNAAVRPGGMGKAYVQATPLSLDHPEAGTNYSDVTPKMRTAGNVSFSMSRTVGLWLAAFFTLCAFSFLYGDNPFYKLAEGVFVGTSAAYTMVQAFWAQLVPNLFGTLMPKLIKATFVPSIDADDLKWIRLVPLALSIMLLWRLAPRGQWIARWPLAVVIGTMAGIQLVVFIQSDLVSQVRNTIVPLIVINDQHRFDIGQSVVNILTVGSVLLCLLYFFFSIEHKGAVGRAARMGMWVLMIAFGASFALTVMGRITLLTDRISFLFDDWLWLIDPEGNRAVAAAAGMMLGWTV